MSGGLNLQIGDPNWMTEAYVYGAGDPARPLAAVPDDFWRKITMLYPDGNTTAFVYLKEGPNSDNNYRELMWRLQHQLPPEVRCMVTDENREVVDVPLFQGEAL